MMENQMEHREYERYETQRKVRFDFVYDMETKMKFQVTQNEEHKQSHHKYLALSKNVSSEGLCFVSQKRLEKGDYLDLEVYLPGDQELIHLEGEVKWCAHTQQDKRLSENQQFDTGVKLMSVEGKLIKDTVYFDETYQVQWSSVLEAILGKFRILMQDQKNKKGTGES